MILEYYTFKNGWNTSPDISLDSPQTLILVFGSPNIKKITEPLEHIKNSFKNSIIIGASSAGEIVMDELIEDSLVIAVLKFANSKIRLSTEHVKNASDSYLVGQNIASSLNDNDLKAIFILSDGLNVNGSQLTSGVNSALKQNTIVTGGLAGDGARFESTWVIVDGEAKSNYVVAVGLYGESIHIGHGFKGGWDKFGIQRIVTHSVDNVLYELDNQPALDIYKKYLGNKAKELPSSGLLFPLELQEDINSDKKTVRTILAVDEKERSITFAGDIPEGSCVSLMKANHDRLIDGAFNASKSVKLDGYNDEPLLCIAISCIGRKLVLKQRIEDELEATLQNLPNKTKQVGFYSYGEISPVTSGGCDLHNQTMTLTLLWESNV